MPQHKSGEIQIFVRIPTGLRDEIDALADKHYRSGKGEFCAVMEFFVNTPVAALDRRDWRYDPHSTDVVALSLSAPEPLNTNFRNAAGARCENMSVALSRGAELWIEMDKAETPKEEKKPARRKREAVPA